MNSHSQAKITCVVCGSAISDKSNYSCALCAALPSSMQKAFDLCGALCVQSHLDDKTKEHKIRLLPNSPDREKTLSSSFRALLSTREYGCDVCGNPIADHCDRMCCLDCTASILDNTFDLCSAECVIRHSDEAKPGERHRIVKNYADEPGICIYSSYARTLVNRFRCYAERKFIGNFINGSWEYDSFDDVYVQSRSLATYLRRITGDEVAPRIVITGANSSEWVIADVAAVFMGAVSIPLHTTLNEHMLALLIEKANAHICVCDEKQWLKLQAMDCGLQHVIVMKRRRGLHSCDGLNVEVQCNAGCAPQLHSWDQAVSIDEEEWDDVMRAQSSDELRTVLYTSGSTGIPKAARVTDGLLLVELSAGYHHLPIGHFGFHPMAYSTLRYTLVGTISAGGRMCFWNGDSSTFFDQLKAACVGSFSAPPRVWGALFSLYKALLGALTSIDADLEDLESEDEAVTHNAKKQIIAILGPNCQHISTGGAATPPAVMKWMRSVCAREGIHVSEGYGITETGPVASNGVRTSSCSVHLEDVLEMGYLSSNRPSQGLLWVHTPRMAPGYWNDLESTAENFRDIYGDGRMWFNTGDIVEYDARTEELRVIDRVKNLVKLAQAVFVSPEYLESIFASSPLVSSIWVHAENGSDFVVAVVQPNQEALQHAAWRTGLAWSADEGLCASAEAEKLVLDSLRLVGTRANLQQYEIPRAILLTSHSWSPESGELTLSLKIARPFMRKAYAKILLDKTKNATRIVDIQSHTDPSNDTSSPHSTFISESMAGDATRDWFLQTVCAICQVSLCKETLERKLPELGIDSTSMMELTQILKQKEIPLPSMDILVGKPLSVVADAIAEGQVGQVVIDWRSECSLPGPLLAQIACSPAKVKRSTPSVFLTGATGFVGSFILKYLLGKGRTVICLVRSHDLEEAFEKLVSKALFFNTGLGAEEIRNNVRPVCGDLARPGFGLTDAQLDRLALSIDCIIHNGAVVTGVLTHSLICDVNSRSTLDCISLSARASASLVYISSLSALCGLETGAEATPPSENALPGMNSYGATKRISEIYIWKAIMGGLKTKCAILRPGTIGPCSAGSLSPNDTLTRYLCSIAQLGIAPAGNTPVSVCSVSDVARCAVLCSDLIDWSGVQKQTEASNLLICNITDTTAISLEKFTSIAQKSGFKIRSIPMSEFVSHVLSKDAAKCALAPLRSYFERGFPLGADPYIDVSVLTKLFEISGESRELVDDQEIEACYAWLRQRLLSV